MRYIEHHDQRNHETTNIQLALARLAKNDRNKKCVDEVIGSSHGPIVAGSRGPVVGARVEPRVDPVLHPQVDHRHAPGPRSVRSRSARAPPDARGSDSAPAPASGTLPTEVRLTGVRWSELCYPDGQPSAAVRRQAPGQA